MVNVTQLKKANATRWQAVQITGNLVAAVDKIAARLVAAVAKTRYQSVAAKTKVPWFIIAVIHEREASQSWKGNLAQGDPWNKPSIHVPKGRGPFDSWEDAAVDALENCDPFAAEWKDGRPAGR